MKIENGVISSSQLMFLIIGLFQGSALTASFIVEVVKQNMLIIAVISAILMIPLFLIFIYLGTKFYGKNLIEINDIVYGKYIGKVISLLYINFFGLIVFSNFRYTSDFFTTYMFEKTNMIVFIFGIAFVSMYAVRNGIETIARITPIIAISTICVIIFITIATIKDASLKNFLPFLQINLKDAVQGISFMLSITFGELISLLMIFPCVGSSKNKIKKYSYIGYVIGTMFLLMGIIRNTAVLGNIASIHRIPSYQIARILRIGEIITRAEVLIAMVLFFDTFVKVCIMYYAAVLGIAQLFKLRSYKPLVLPIGIVGIIQAFFASTSNADYSYLLSSIYPIYGIIFVVIIPIISLTIILIRKLFCKSLV
ncbi:endospore germination permease [Clostridium sp. JN-1]|uniref:GerAB/ArcD/ProY family transporter n=1 Tax=Clostridium sp. JN-1 TaxID=2483110 RepID=UPI000F0B76A2|nr:endospore germination permease [Clostridium sp. JN-1]